MAEQKSWVRSLLTPQLVIYLAGGLVAVVIFWTRTQSSWAKVNELEGTVNKKATVDAVKAIDEKVNRQYQTNREMNEKLINEIEEIKLWIEFEKGKQSVKK